MTQVQRYADGTTLKVWRFTEAPPHLRNLSTNGGDEDIITAEPTMAPEGYPSARSIAQHFGMCSVQEGAAIIEGVASRIYIGCHA